jgi:DNA-binding transcriptional LysR family regulator
MQLRPEQLAAHLAKPLGQLYVLHGDDPLLTVEAGDALRAAAVGGLGVINEPDFLLEEALRSGNLVRLLTDYAGGSGDIWAVYPSRRHLSLKVRLFVDHIAGTFAGAPPNAPAAPHQ